MSDERAHRLTLMTVMGHPDDETMWAGGTMARYAHEGLRVVCVTCTAGENGDIVVPELDTPENRAHLGEIRVEELTRALARLGPIESRRLGYGDSGVMHSPLNADPRSFWQADLDEATGRLVRIVREVMPDVIVTFDETGITGHPDHIRAGEIARAAYHRAGDPTAYTDQLSGADALMPWAPSKLYVCRWSTDNRDKLKRMLAAEGVLPTLRFLTRYAINRRAKPETASPPDATTQQTPTTTFVDVTPWVDAKMAAMAENRTQVAARPRLPALCGCGDRAVRAARITPGGPHSRDRPLRWPQVETDGLSTGADEPTTTNAPPRAAAETMPRSDGLT